ncbi:MAG: magnesium transporter MgtE N-terminal domain-containing protein [Armatimonadota bacterium]
MIFFAEAFLSDLLRMSVVDLTGARVGRMQDVAVKLGEAFPPATKIAVRRRGERLVLPWSAVRSVSTEAITLNQPLAELRPVELEEGEVLLEESVLDKQIVDIEGHRVVKVNDLKLGAVHGAVRLVAAGVGTRSLLRRLGLEGAAIRLWGVFGRRPHERLIGWEHVHSLDPASQQLHLDVERAKLKRLNPADLADILGEMSALDRAKVVSSLDDETAAAALEEMDFELQQSVLNSLGDEKAADILDEVNPDDAADLVGDLPRERADQLLNLMEPEEASDVKELLKYPDDTAGGLMTPEFVSVPSGMTAQEAIGYLRKAAEEAETVYYLYVVDRDGRLIGVFELRDLIVAPPTKAIDDIMMKDVIAVSPETSHEETAGLMARYNLLALPVIDEQRKLLGIVTVDDAIEAVLPARLKRQLPRVFSR